MLLAENDDARKVGKPMSQNDLLHLNANFKNWQDERGAGLAGLTSVDPYLLYCVEQFLKPFDLTDEEILSGIVDGSHDGGVDAIYFLVNGQLVREDTILEPKAARAVHLVILQIKKGDEGFKPTEINKLFFFTDDLLDLSRDMSLFPNKYRPSLLALMVVFKEKYRLIAGQFPAVTIEYHYVTKGDNQKPNAAAAEMGSKVENKVKEHLNKATCHFNFVNAQALLEQIQRRPPAKRELTWRETPIQTDEGYVGLVEIRNLYKFLQDANGQLANRIFESNVRGFQQDTQVNRQIRDTLRSATKVNFWLLNNGITILAAKAGTAGPKRLNLEDAQIVNGLQSSREVFDYFKDVNPRDDGRSILVRVIETTDPVVRDAVIKATNSQNKMPAASLRAVDPIHNQIEDLFKQYDLYYDRRKGFYKDQGKPVAKIVSINEVLQAVVAIVLQRPDDARARPGDYIREDSRYEQVFGENTHPLGAYLACTLIARRVQKHMSSIEIDYEDQRNVRFYVATYLACAATASAVPAVEKLVTVDAASLSDQTVAECYDRVWYHYQELGGNDTVAKGPELLKAIKRELRRRYAVPRPRRSKVVP